MTVVDAGARKPISKGMMGITAGITAMFFLKSAQSGEQSRAAHRECAMLSDRPGDGRQLVLAQPGREVLARADNQSLSAIVLVAHFVTQWIEQAKV